MVILVKAASPTDSATTAMRVKPTNNSSSYSSSSTSKNAIVWNINMSTTTNTTTTNIFDSLILQLQQLLHQLTLAIQTNTRIIVKIEENHTNQLLLTTALTLCCILQDKLPSNRVFSLVNIYPKSSVRSCFLRVIKLYRSLPCLQAYIDGELLHTLLAGYNAKIPSI